MIDQSAAGSVDEDGSLLHLCDVLGVHQMLRLAREWQVEGDDIRFGQ